MRFDLNVICIQTKSFTIILFIMFILSNLEDLANRYDLSKKSEIIICEDECGCSGDCGSNWMRS